MNQQKMLTITESFPLRGRSPNVSIGNQDVAIIIVDSHLQRVGMTVGSVCMTQSRASFPLRGRKPNALIGNQ